MTFPTVPTVAGGRVLTAVQANTTATRTFPTLTDLTKNSGDLLVAICVAYQTSTGTNAAFSGWTGGFTEFHDSATSTTMAIGMAYKFSDGSETGTFAVTQAATITGHAVFVLLSIPAAHASSIPEAGSRASGTSAAADPASFNPSWAAEDILWVAVGGSGETSGTGSYTGIAGPPADYADGVQTGISGDVVGGVEGAVAFRQLNADSEDVGTRTVDVSNARNAAVVIAVRPAAGANFTRTVDDTVGLSDGSQAVTREGVLTDPLGLTDTVDPVLTGGSTRQADDTVGVTDTVALDLGIGLTDAVDVTDSSLRTDVAETVDDTVGLTDSVDVTFSGGGFTRTVNDTVGLTDAQALDLSATPVDTVGLADDTAIVVAYARQVDDTVGLTDTAQVEQAGAGTRQVDDILGLTDARTIDRSLGLVDAVGLTDAVAVDTGAIIARQVDDTVGLTDVAALARDVGAADLVAVTDTLNVEFAGGYLRTVDDLLGLTDTASQATIYVRTVDDLLGLSDFIPPETSRGVVTGRSRSVSTTDGRTRPAAAITGRTRVVATVSGG